MRSQGRARLGDYVALDTHLIRAYSLLINRRRRHDNQTQHDLDGDDDSFLHRRSLQKLFARTTVAEWRSVSTLQKCEGLRLESASFSLGLQEQRLRWTERLPFLC